MAMQAILGCSMATPPLALRSLPCSSRHHTFLSSKHSEFSAPASSKLACPSTSSAAASATLVTGPFLVRPLASRVCDLTGKRANNGYKVSFSKHRTKTLQGVNLQYKRLWWEEGKRFVRLRLSTKALKTVEKNGLDAMAKKAGIDLTKH